MKTILAALALATPLALTSCEGALDDIFGEWDKPTPTDNSGSGSTPAASNTYLKWNGTDALVPTELPDAPKMTASTTSWSGTYIVDDDITIDASVTLGGDVDLIILDGKTLKITNDHQISYNGASNFTLNIYSQSAGSGKLIVTTSADDTGGCIYYPISIIGNVNIHGGDITSTATGDGTQGIFAKNINIYGGKVSVNGQMEGIMTTDLSVYGGEVVAETGLNSSGAIYCEGNLKMSGATTKITATGADGDGTIAPSPAIYALNITIDRGELIATGGAGGAGQDGSYAIVCIDNTNTTSGKLTLNGGSVKATGGAKGTGGAVDGKAFFENTAMSAWLKTDIIVATGFTYYEDDSPNPSENVAGTAGDGTTPILNAKRYVEIK